MQLWNNLSGKYFKVESFLEIKHAIDSSLFVKPTAALGLFVCIVLKS